METKRPNLAQGLRPDVQRDWQWADSLSNQVKAIVHRCAFGFLSIKQTTASYEDLQEATDMLIDAQEGAIAARVRRPDCQRRDLTIRSWRRSGALTELSKIRSGFADYYLYCWTKEVSEKEKIHEWMLIDLSKVRKLKLLRGRTGRGEIINKEGLTGFINIPRQELLRKDCVVCCYPDDAWYCMRCHKRQKIIFSWPCPFDGNYDEPDYNCADLYFTKLN